MQRIVYPLVLIFFLVACENDEGGGGADNAFGPTTWQFENFNYDGGASANVFTVLDDFEIGVLSVTTAEDRNKGDYSGSSIVISYNKVGTGSYALMSLSEMVTLLNENPDSKVASLVCTVGTATNNGTTSYETEAVGAFVEVEVGDDGKYQFNIDSSIRIPKSIDVESGVENAPEIADFSLENAYDFSN